VDAPFVAGDRGGIRVDPIVDHVATWSSEDRAALFAETAAGMGFASPVIPEKDFWVCFTLRRLFELEDVPRLLFKGGTSLSKAFRLIERFSEDIDLALHREDLGFGGANDPVRITGRKARKRKDMELAKACGKSVHASVAPALRDSIARVLGSDGWSLRIDDKQDGQADLWFEYPRGLSTEQYGGVAYIPSVVRIEIGARSDHEPASVESIVPYAAERFPELFADAATDVRVLSAERTFWEKITIFHAEYHRPVGQHGLEPAAWKQMSRHAYDIDRMVRRGVADRAMEQLEILAAVARHKDAFYYSGWARYGAARPGTLRICPNEELTPALRRDYEEMAPMLYGERPEFDEILHALAALETRINESC